MRRSGVNKRSLTFSMTRPSSLAIEICRHTQPIVRSPGAAAVLFSNSFAARGPTSALPNPSKCIMALSASYLEIEAVALVDGK